MKTRTIEVPRRRPVRRYKHCGCRKNRAGLIYAAHTPLARWGFTLLALLAATNQLTAAAILNGLLAAWAWRHR